MMENPLMNYHVDDALELLNQAEYGAHYIIIYPHLDTLRELYSNYVGKQIEDNNEIVLMNHFMKLLILLDKYFLKNIIMV
jgi:hypothetical protein